MDVAGKYREELIANAKKIAAPGKGILAADESTGTIGKRFDAISVENTEENRQAYRELLFTTEGFEDSISGAILYEETLYQSTKAGEKFVDILNKKDVLVGIKVDKGPVQLAGCATGEMATQGLDGLAERCAKYYEAGARFAKWRAVLIIDTKKNCPSEASIAEVAHGLARYATICQANGLVPIVEPEILMDGDHTLADCVEATTRTIRQVYTECEKFGMLLEGSLLKPNMCTPGQGNESYSKVSPSDIGIATVTALSRSVPAAVPGITFLSGGQGESDATANLNAINAVDTPLARPWNLSFSYGRALQASCLKAWQGKAENVKAAQDTWLALARQNGQAAKGEYKGDGKKSESLYEANYRY